MPILGPKCSLYYMIISAWGIVMLAFLGLFFKIRCPALFEDTNVSDDEWHHNNFSMEYIQEKYDDQAVNCWIAAGIYGALFLFAFINQRLNARKSYQMS